MKRIAVITGGRDYTPTPRELGELHSVLTRRDIDIVRTGGCRGVDTVVHKHVRDVFERESWPAEDYGPWPACGPKRNAAMLSTRGVRVCIAFKGGAGTWNCIRAAKARGIDVWIIGEGLCTQPTPDTQP